LGDACSSNDVIGPRGINEIDANNPVYLHLPGSPLFRAAQQNYCIGRCQMRVFSGEIL
jgi:hypothetical protein